MLTYGYCADDGAERLVNRDGGHCFLHNSAVMWILLSSTHWDFIAPRILEHTALPMSCRTPVDWNDSFIDARAFLSYQECNAA